MLEEMTLSKGSPLLGDLSFVRYSSALIASSPRTAYSTLRKEGLSESRVRGAMVLLLLLLLLVLVFREDEVDKNRNRIKDPPRVLM